MYMPIGYIFHPEWEGPQPIKQDLRFESMDALHEKMSLCGIDNYLIMLEEVDEEEVEDEE